MTLITALQCCIYPRGKQRVHRLVALFILGSVGSAVGYAAAIWAGWGVGWRLQEFVKWVWWLYYLSFIKMIVSQGLVG
jgi:hypothetical protein